MRVLTLRAEPKGEVEVMFNRLIWCGVSAFFFSVTAQVALAQDPRVVRLGIEEIGTFRVIEDVIMGHEMVDYVVRADRSEIISVDLQASNPSAYFNVLSTDTAEAIFVGSTEGNVADIPAPVAGDYVIRVYLMRNAARRGETADFTLGVAIGRPEYADGLSGGPDYWMVSGLANGGALNLRAGPATRYEIVGVLRNGNVLRNQGCRLTGQERWCRIRAAGSGVMGWVAGRYLVETGAPRAPAVPENGPVGNGTPFDATGSVPCATAPDQPMQQCPFGVIRSGPGNAGVWIALGDGSERQILFEGGVPVATGPAGALSFDAADGLFKVRVDTERYEIPEAVVNGG